MDKKQKSVIAVYVIIFIVFNILFWGVPFPKNTASIVVYVFSLISIIAALGITYIAFEKGSDVKSKVYGLPVFKMGIIYAAVQILFGIVICVIACFIEIPTWISVVLSVILAGLVAIGVIATDSTRDIIIVQDEMLAAQTRKVKYFKLDMDSVIDKCKDAELKKKLEKFAEELKYSDPVSSDELESIEKKIADGIGNLSELVNKDNAAANDNLEELTNLLSDRNRRCKALKK